MGQERLPRRSLEWCPPGRQRRGRARNSWMQVTTEMREREREREENWRLGMIRQTRVEKENKFALDTERCENI